MKRLAELVVATMYFAVLAYALHFLVPTVKLSALGAGSLIVTIIGLVMMLAALFLALSERSGAAPIFVLVLGLSVCEAGILASPWDPSVTAAFVVSNLLAAGMLAFFNAQEHARDARLHFAERVGGFD